MHYMSCNENYSNFIWDPDTPRGTETLWYDASVYVTSG